MTASIKAGAGKTISKDATFEVFTKRSSGMRCGRMHIASPFKLAARGKHGPGVEVRSDVAIEQALPKMAALA